MITDLGHCEHFQSFPGCFVHTFGHLPRVAVSPPIYYKGEFNCVCSQHTVAIYAIFVKLIDAQKNQNPV